MAVARGQTALATACMETSLIKKLLAAAALAAAVVATPASAYEQRDFIGTFTCAVGGLTARTTYTADGRFFSEGVMEDAPTQLGMLDLAMTVTGVWTVAGDQLTETGQGYELVYVRIDDQPVDPSSELYAQMRAGMDQTIGTDNVRTVLGLSPASMSVSYQGSPPLECARS